MVSNKHDTKRDMEADTPIAGSVYAHRFHDNNDMSPSRL